MSASFELADSPRRRAFVMTGGTSGLGIPWLHALAAESDVDLYVLVRSPAKLRALELQAGSGTEVRPIHCDLASFASIRRAASEVLAESDSLDLLVHNAGVWQTERVETEDGLETTLAVNHLAPFLLTALLAGPLRAAGQETGDARVVVTSSFQHARGALDWNDLEGKRSYDGTRAYRQSKLCTVLYMRELARRWAPNGVQATAFDPGMVATPMTRTAFPAAVRWAYPMAARLALRSPPEGADTGVYLSLNPAVCGQTGGYYKDRQLREPSARAQSASDAQRLWEVSEGYTGAHH